MKTIKQQETIAFNAISFKDAVILLPLMNALVDCINQNKLAQLWNGLTDEGKNQYRRVWGNCDMHLTAEAIEQAYTLLHQLGFEAQTDIKEPTLDDLKKKD